MLKMEIRNFTQEQWTNVIYHMLNINLMQTWEFGEAKATTGPWEVHRAIFKEGEHIVAAVQILIRKVPLTKRGLAFLNRGPLVISNHIIESGLYFDILRLIRKIYVEENNMYLRISPPLSATEMHYFCLKESGFFRTSDYDGWSSDMIDLSLPLEKIRKGMQQKWRNCLHKAEHLGVSYESGYSDALMSELLLNYTELVTAKKFKTSVTPEFILSIQALLPETNKMRIYAGRLNGDRMGAILIATFGNISLYFIGSINDLGKKFCINHFLLWNAIKEMKEKGMHFFDLGGVNPISTPKGILHFKRGLGGFSYQYVGAMDAFRTGVLNNLIKFIIQHKQ